MKNIRVFIFLVSIFYVFFMSPAIMAETALIESPGSGSPFPYTFSVASLAGFLYGQGEEIVYKYNTGDTYLSQLLWDMKPLFYIGTALNFSRINPLEKWGFFADLSFKFGIPSKTGGMEDRDWQADSGALTDFSSHENYTQGAFLLDFSAGFSIPLFSKAVFKIYGEFSYMRFSWASQNGYLQYATETNGVYEPWDSSLPKTYNYGPAISYSQKWFLVSPGIALFIPFLEFFSGGVFFQCTPLIWCIAKDEHFARNIEFIDKVFGGILLEPKGEFTFSPHAKIDLTLSLGYRYISGPKGITYSRLTGTSSGSSTFWSAGRGGAGYSVLDMGFSVKIRF